MSEIPLGIRTGQVLEEDQRPVGLTQLLGRRERGQSALIKSSNVEFQDVQDTLAANMRATLPQDLVAKFSLDVLKWRFITAEDSLPVLFIAAPQKGSDLNHSTVTLDIERRPSNGALEPKGTVMAAAVRFAGVAPDSRGRKRVLAATYGGYDKERRIYAFDISIEDDEEPEEFKHAISRYYESSIPTSIEYPYYTEGFITAVMANEASEGANPISNVIRFYDSTNLGENVKEMRVTTMGGEIKDYHLDQKSSNIRVAYSGRPNKWEVIMPRSLKKI